jgi:hypothetical protein
LIKIRPESLKSLYIELKFGNSVLASATGFVVAIDSDKSSFLVTARHNFTGKDSVTGKCLHHSLGIPDRVAVHFHKKRTSDVPAEFEVLEFKLLSDSRENLWMEHPKFRSNADIAALRLDLDESIYLSTYDLFEEHEKEVGPADPVSVIGFPFGKKSDAGLPLWATGYMSSEPNLDFEGKPVLIIDCRGRQGQSGSPVISFQSNGIIGHNTFQGVWTAPSSEFLGVYCGRINKESDLGIVWKRSAICELVGVK